MLHGVNISFIVAAIFAVIALIMAFFIKNSRPENPDDIRPR